AQAGFCGEVTAGGSADSRLAIEAVTSTSSFAAGFAGTGSGSAGLAAVVCGGAASVRGFSVPFPTPAITAAVTKVASSRPNALRITTRPKRNENQTGSATPHSSIHAKKVFTAYQHGQLSRAISGG